MTPARFIQVHTLHSYSAALLNRDDSGLAKRLPYGGKMRTRISSQCLKRHWRLADDPHALEHLAGFVDAKRSRELVTLRVIDPLGLDKNDPARAVLDALFQTQVYGDKGTDRKGRQTLLFGEPELKWLADQARDLLPKVRDALANAKLETIDTTKDQKSIDKQLEKRAKDAQKATEGVTKPWSQSFKKNIDALRETIAMPGGLTAAMFGRMVTSDTAANIDAPIHVAHAFTVHGEETESDYFVAVDDLKRDGDDSGADTIQETELTSGLYYGYTVIDVAGLVANTSMHPNKHEMRHKDWLAADIDRQLAAEVAHNLLYLIAEVSPGAKLGSTAPYGRAELMLVEVGDRQPRSLAAAFREACAPDVTTASRALATQLSWFDATYATGEARRALHRLNDDLPSAPRASLAEMAMWLRSRVVAGAGA